ncbi:hypothetical protein [Dictyobacter formicarum]|uniref:Ferric oxidoreductase domain-containing protein n=1 Tax=Dictyobacter formicarum TaxID=2778368 RepID=A0ABQ3VGU8_9CHLR|nr:hypothetical protein [Dictyobacter formicarum]GHO85409.1 hypothetical protein KSZ_34150 [Dictyobacter formicarum]
MKRLSDEKGYPWFFLDTSQPWLNTWFVTLILILIFILSLFVYAHFSKDLSPDSLAGYTYGIVGNSFMLLATFLYTRSRRQRRRRVGQLNQSLNWHICFGVLAIVILLLHSFGNFNPRTGTYALEGMIALVISGFIGRIIDRFAPRQITKEVKKALTEHGDDRIEDISRNVQEIVTYNTQNLRTFRPQGAIRSIAPQTAQVVTPDPVSLGGTALPSSWDIAYISLEEMPQEVSRNSQQYRFVPDKKSALATPGALMPGYNEQIEELQSVQRALQREQFYRALIRYWRIFHVLLVLLTLTLTIWHLVYAGQLLIPTFFHH